MTNRSIDPIVSTDWLQSQLPAKGKEPRPGTEALVIIDTRFAEDYEAGHIPGAISVPFALVSAWADCTEELLLELPPEADLMKTIGDCGLTAESKVVIVGRLPVSPEPPYPLADPVRVAATLMYAGVKNVAVLAGGHAKWVAEGRETTTEVPKVTPVPYGSAVDAATWISTEYVKDHIGKCVLIDGRDPDQYFGASIDPFADMRGHIPTARNLPMVWVWEPEGTYRPFEFIESMVTGVVGADKDQEVITYCGVGGYAATWWFLLSQLLGYRNVKIYDGSMEAWVDGGNPLVRYTWTQ
jgi:thiosulfate/3-mercaptopyruvate sulfurtransferase